MIHRRRLRKPDGRTLLLYSDRDLPEHLEAPQPPGPAVVPAPQLRWHPLRGIWVDYAGHRQDRTFLPPSGWNPLGPSPSRGDPTEVPAGSWRVAVFENRFPSLTLDAPEALDAPPGARPGIGVCEVVVYTQAPTGSLGELELEHLELLIEVWADRTRELGALETIEYVMPFENRGVEVGATLHHPHGQIYAYPFVPPVPAQELALQKEHYELHKRGLVEVVIDQELRDGRRMLFAGDRAVAFIPAFAQYPYEAWVAPRDPVPSLVDLDGPTRTDLARALKTLVRKYDGLRETPFPYVMVFHQAPTDGLPHPEAHLHIEFYPPYRTRDRLKYLAGTELGAGMFTNDALPEQAAAELRAIDVVLEPRT